jgi:threonine dehydrogenase-like Zn-dependent dehydrogenase
MARRFGATAAVSSKDGKAAEAVMKMTGARGVDTAIEAVGVPATFELCQQIIAPGGTIANIGVHGTKVALHLERLWDRNITITTRLVDTVSTPMLLSILGARKLDPKRFAPRAVHARVYVNGEYQGLFAAVEEVAFTGRVVYIGYAKELVAYETRLFVQKELDIMGSRNALPEDFRRVIQLLEGHQFPVDDCVSSILPIEEAPAILRSWSDDPARFSKIMIRLD